MHETGKADHFLNWTSEPPARDAEPVAEMTPKTMAN
jgi:hypothetical protein